MHISESGLNFIKEREAYRQFAYPDPYSPLYRAFPSRHWGFKPASEILKDVPQNIQNLSGSPWTVGYGETSKVTPETTRSLSEADSFLRGKVQRYESLVLGSITGETTQGQFDMLVSIAWNVESAVSPKSTIIKRHNEQNWAEAARAFKLYNKVRVNGKLVVSSGLNTRRAMESANYLAASPAEDYAQELPSRIAVVESERPLRNSEINQAATVGSASVAAAGAAEVARSVKDLKDSLSGIAEWAPIILMVVGIAAFGYIMYQRYRQRKEGWA